MMPAKVVVCRQETINGVEQWVPYTSPTLTTSEMGEAIQALSLERVRRAVAQTEDALRKLAAPNQGGVL